MTINIHSIIKDKISQQDMTKELDSVNYPRPSDVDYRLYSQFTELFKQLEYSHYAGKGFEDLFLLSKTRKKCIQLTISNHNELLFAIATKRLLEKVGLGLTFKLSERNKELVALANGDKSLKPLLYYDFFKTKEKEILSLVKTQKLSCEINNKHFFPEFYKNEVQVSGTDKRAWDLRDKFSDAVFVIKGKEFKVSKLLLSSTSEYYEKLFTSGTLETKQERVEIDLNIEPDSFERLLEYIYTKKSCLEKVPLADLEHLTSFAHMAKLDGFEWLCINEYRCRLTSESFFEILKVAKRIEIESLKEHCIFFRDTHPNWFKNHIHLNEYTIEGLADLLSTVQYVGKYDFEEEITDRCLKKINHSNFPEISQRARKANNETLKAICLSYADQNWKQMDKSVAYDIRKEVLLLRMDWNEKDYQEFINEQSPLKK